MQLCSSSFTMQLTKLSQHMHRMGQLSNYYNIWSRFKIGYGKTNTYCNAMEYCIIVQKFDGGKSDEFKGWLSICHFLYQYYYLALVNT